MTSQLLAAISAPGMEALGAAADAVANARFKVPALAGHTTTLAPIWTDAAQVRREIDEDDRRHGL